MTPTLDTFQHETLRWLDGEDGHVRGRAILADPMGARKTGTTLAWLARANVLKTLVVAPGSVHRHWFREASRFYEYAGHYAGAGTKDQRAANLARCNETASEGLPAIYVTTYDSMKGDQHAIMAADFDCVVFDEGHRLKGRRTQVALCANRVTAKPANLIIVTGTKVLNHASEVWQYLHMLDPKRYRSFWSWVELHYDIDYAYYNGRGNYPTKVIKDFLPGHDELVRKELEPYLIERDIKELFPDAVWTADAEHVVVPVELSPAERKAYDKLVKFRWTEVGDHAITTDNGLTVGTRLQQITSDWGVFDEKLEMGTKAKATIEKVLDLVERDEPVLVVAKYKSTVARIVEALIAKGVEARSYTGDTNDSLKDMVVQSFAAGKVDVIVGTLDSISEGVDGLQHRCNELVMVDRHWVAEKNNQCIGRLRRSGQERVVNVTHIYAEETVDGTVMDACLRKENVVAKLKGMPLIDFIYGRV